MKSGEKEFKITHSAIFKYKKLTGEDILESFNYMSDENFDIGTVYNVLYAGLKGYKTIEEMLDDMLEDEFVMYTRAAMMGLGQLFEAMNKNIKQGSEKDKQEIQA